MKPDRKRIYAKYNGRCGYCGEKLQPRWHVDHIIPRNNFTSRIRSGVRVPESLKHLTSIDINNYDNLMPSCMSCNNYKSTMDIELFRSEIGQLPHRLNDRITQYKIAKRFNLVYETKQPVIFYFETL